ncbi:MAG TPA: hypothetical protein PLJ47_01890, partial [Candidatus Hydrogenedentes bacterium]|nr:hypothetical protein [Candidatus Hydrogenedentota bacterium]
MKRVQSQRRSVFQIITPMLFVASTVFGQEGSGESTDFPLVSSNPMRITASGTYAVFLANDGLHGQEVWISDGTSEGTRMLADLSPGQKSTETQYLIPRQDKIFVPVQEGQNAALYTIGLPGDSNALIPSPNRIGGVSSDIRVLATTPNRIYLNASQFIPGSFNVGRELWVTDFEAGETRLVIDLWPGDKGSDPGFDGARAAMVGDELYFVAYWRLEGGRGESSTGLWRTDGTEEGTKFVKAVEPDTFRLVAVDDRLFFCSNVAEYGQELWTSDGTPEGTIQIADINPGRIGSSPQEFIVAEKMLVFQADDGAHGSELWCYDPKIDSTRLLADICSGFSGSSPHTFVRSNDALFFIATDKEHGKELWSYSLTNGTAHLVRDINPGEA